MEEGICGIFTRLEMHRLKDVMGLSVFAVMRLREIERSNICHIQAWKRVTKTYKKSHITLCYSVNTSSLTFTSANLYSFKKIITTHNN